MSLMGSGLTGIVFCFRRNGRRGWANVLSMCLHPAILA